MLSLKDVADAFVLDGSWRDLYVLDTRAADWNSMLAWLRLEYASASRFTFEDQVGSLPATIEEILTLRESGSPLLSVSLSGLAIRCHFFCDLEIEFDLDPREINEARFVALQQFMQGLGTLLKRSVLLTPENDQKNPLLVYLLEVDQVLYVSRCEQDKPL